MNKTGIEYGDVSWNFYPGCLHKPQGKCPVAHCWAEGMTKRQRKDFHNPHLIPEKLLEPLSRKKPARILVNFMGDLFGDWVDFAMIIKDEGIAQRVNWQRTTYTVMPGKMSLLNLVFRVCEECPQHTFLFLTKNPAGLLPWSPFPDNCWVGTSVCNDKMLDVAVDKLEDVEAKNKFISFEPLLKKLTLSLDYALYYSGINWVIIGAQTSPLVMPKWEWVKEIIDAADEVSIPVFLKDNLGLPQYSCEGGMPFYKPCNGTMKLRQEFPA